jgi:trans-aconitate methyltransferase
MNNTDDNVATTRQTYNHIHEQYASSNPALHDDVQKSLDRFISYLSGKNVLDVGCASGYESKYLHDHGLNVTGCDISSEFVHAAQERCPDCTFFEADMRHLQDKVTPGTLDGIWANASFLHIPKKDAFPTLQGFHDLLDDNGILYVSVMRGDFDDLRANKDMHWPDRHFSDYQEDELEDILEHVGLNVFSKNANTTSWGPTFLIYFCKKS